MEGGIFLNGNRNNIRPGNGQKKTRQAPNTEKKNTSDRKKQKTAREQTHAPAPKPVLTKAQLTELRRREAQQALRERKSREAEAAKQHRAQDPRRAAPAAPHGYGPTKKNAAAHTPPLKDNRTITPPKKQGDQKRTDGPKKKTRPTAESPKDKKKKPEQRRQAAPGEIHRQTPSIRKEDRKGKKITGSVKHIEVKPHAKTSRTRYRVKKKKKSWKAIFSGFVRFLLVFAAVFAVSAGLFYFNLSRTVGISSSDVTVQIGENDAETTETFTASAKRAFANGTYNISIDLLRDYCDLTVTGDAQRLRYIPRESEKQSVTFEIGTNTAWVNGVQVRMEKACFLSGGNLYVPVSFFDRYAKNLTIQHAPSENKITVIRTETAESVASTARDKIPVYEPIVFNLSGDAPVKSITEQSVDES